MSNIADSQGDLAFEAMDDALDRVRWRPGFILIQHTKNALYCYDLAAVRRALEEIGQTAVLRKYAECQVNMSDIVNNIIDEYHKEFQDYGFFREPRIRRKPRVLRTA